MKRIAIGFSRKAGGVWIALLFLFFWDHSVCSEVILIQGREGAGAIPVTLAGVWTLTEQPLAVAGSHAATRSASEQRWQRPPGHADIMVMHECQNGLTQLGLSPLNLCLSLPQWTGATGAVPGDDSWQAGTGTLVSPKDKYTKSRAKWANSRKESPGYARLLTR